MESYSVNKVKKFQKVKNKMLNRLKENKNKQVKKNYLANKYRCFVNNFFLKHGKYDMASAKLRQIGRYKASNKQEALAIKIMLENNFSNFSNLEIIKTTDNKFYILSSYDLKKSKDYFTDFNKSLNFIKKHYETITTDNYLYCFRK